MKKTNILLILLISTLLPMKTISAADSIFIWDTDTIIIPYGESLDDALETFKASVNLKEGYMDSDFTVFDINYNYCMKSVISTNNITTYKLYHKAISPKYQKEEIKLIYIKIVDINKPVVTNSKPYTFVLGEKKPDYLTSLSYEDDVNKTEEIKVTVNDSNVNYSKVGVYTVIFTLADLSGNEFIHQEAVNIIDLIPPTIKFTDLNTFTIGYTFKVENYVTTSDNHDAVIDIKYEIVEGSLEEEGAVTLLVTATDLSGNVVSASKIIYVEMIDTEPPHIIYCAPFQILVGSTKPNYAKSLIVEDNLSETKNILIVVDESGIDYSKIGSYVVNFQLIDEVGNTSFYQQTVKIFDNVGPTLIFKENNSHPVGFIFDILDFYEITDNYDTHVKYSYSLSSEIDKIGVVNISLIATDSSGNISTATHQITVKDLESPSLSLSQKSIIIEVSSAPIDYLSYVKVSDNYDFLTLEDIEVIPNIDYNTIGEALAPIDPRPAPSETLRTVATPSQKTCAEVAAHRWGQSAVNRPIALPSTTTGNTARRISTPRSARRLSPPAGSPTASNSRRLKRYRKPPASSTVAPMRASPPATMPSSPGYRPKDSRRPASRASPT